MILLDTNVISEVMRPSPNQLVLDWLNDTDSSVVFISSISIAEIEFGLWSLPEGNRRNLLRGKFEQFVQRGFEHRVLDFDAGAARAYGEIMSKARHSGTPMSLPDGQIAAIATVQQAQLSTRNTADFEILGLELINPWKYS